MKVKIDKIIRSRRRTLALQITQDAHLIIRAPKHLSLESIKNTVFKRRLWIKEKQEMMQEKRSPAKEFIEGEGFLYLGDTYKLSIVDRGSEPLSFDNEFKLMVSCRNKAKELFTDWYKKKAYEKISERVEWYSYLLGLKHNSLKLTDAKRRWGSCCVKNNLRFSWRLIMAPLEIIDYVVVHELMHIKVKNHSKKFWDEVRAMMPDYALSRKWLRDNDHLLVI